MLKHEIESGILSISQERQRKYACVYLGCNNLKAIVNRKNQNIKCIYTEIYRAHTVMDKIIYDFENAYGEHFIVLFDEKNKIYVSDTFDKIYEVLANFVICEKDEKRFIIDLSLKYTKLKLVQGVELFKNCANNYIVLHNTRCRMCFFDKNTLQRLGPPEFISILKDKKWVIVTDSAKHYIIVRTTDFAYSLPYDNVSGYVYTKNDNIVRSDRFLIVTLHVAKYIFDITKMECVGNAVYYDIQPINEIWAKVKTANGWEGLNLITGLLS